MLEASCIAYMRHERGVVTCVVEVWSCGRGVVMWSIGTVELGNVEWSHSRALASLLEPQ